MSEAADIAELLAAGFARASRPTKVVLQKSLPRPLLPLLIDVLPMLLLMMTRRLPFLQIAEETDGDTDQVHGVRTQNGPVQVRVCLLSCAEEVCFKNVNAAQLQNQD